MSDNFDLLACAKTLNSLENYYSEHTLGMGACIYHTMGYLLLEAYRKNNPEAKKFVNMLIKNFNDKRKASNKRLDELFDWIDIEKYPVEALEYNKICYDGIYYYLDQDHKTFNGAGSLEFYLDYLSKFAVNTLKRFTAVDGKTGLPRKLDQIDGKNDLSIFKNENKVLVKLTDSDKAMEIEIERREYAITRLKKMSDKSRHERGQKEALLKECKYEELIEIYEKDIDACNQEIKKAEQKIKKLQDEINELQEPFEIEYDFDLDFLDGDELNINYKGLPGNDYDEWQHYRICNWIGQMLRMYMNENGKYKNKLELPFKIQKPEDVVKEYAIVAEKLKKPFVSVHKALFEVGEVYLLYVIDNKKFKPKVYMFDIQDPEIHIYDFESRTRLDKKEVEDLLNQVIEFSKCDPFCSYSTNTHIQPIVDFKKEIYLKQITSVLKYTAEHEKKRLLISKVLFVIGCVITAGSLYLGFYVVNSIRLIYKLKHQNKPKGSGWFDLSSEEKEKYIAEMTKGQMQRYGKNIDSEKDKELDKEQDKKSDYQAQKEKLKQLKQPDENKDKKDEKEKENDKQ